MKKPGRPSLDMIKTTLRLPAATLAAIDDIAGYKRRAEFMRQAIETAVTAAATSKQDDAQKESGAN